MGWSAGEAEERGRVLPTAPNMVDKAFLGAIGDENRFD